MAVLTDPVRLLHYRTCLSYWNYNCYVHFKPGCAERFLKEVGNTPLKGISRFLWEHFSGGGLPDEVQERREEYMGEHDFHYDFRVTLPGLSKVTYIETVLEMADDPEDSTITIVSIHDA